MRVQQVLGQPRLVAYLFAAFCSNVGTWVQRLTLGWLVFDMTGSVGWVGIIAACEVLPAIAVQPLGGVLIDRISRTRALAIGNVLALAQATLLATLFATGALNLLMMVAVALMLGLLEGINQPARLTVISEFTYKKGLRTAVSLNSLAFNLARFVGPLLASLFLTKGSPLHAFTFNAMSFLPMIALLAFTRTLPPDHGEQQRLGSALLSGLRFVRGHPVVFDLLCLAVVVNLCCRSLIELLPAISGYWYDNDPIILSVLTSSVAAGAISGGVWILTRRDMPAVLRTVVKLCGLNCLASLAMAGVGTHLPLAAAAAFCLGLSASGSAVGMQTLVHHTVQSDYLGRTMAIYGLVQRGGAVLGAVMLGAAADLVGLSAPVFAAGCFAAWFTTTIARRIPTLVQAMDKVVLKEEQ